MYCVIAMVKLALIGCAVITMEDGILWPTDQSSKAIVDILLASKERKNTLDCSINYAGGNVLIRGPVEARICSKDKYFTVCIMQLDNRDVLMPGFWMSLWYNLVRKWKFEATCCWILQCRESRKQLLLAEMSYKYKLVASHSL